MLSDKDKVERVRKEIAKWLFDHDEENAILGFETEGECQFNESKKFWFAQAEEILSKVEIPSDNQELPYLEHWDWRQRSHAKNVYYNLLLKSNFKRVIPKEEYTEVNNGNV